jgi:hypothetical protein
VCYLLDDELPLLLLPPLLLLELPPLKLLPVL